MEKLKKQIEISHRFLDESGDSTFFKKGRIQAVGEQGISLAFSIGMVKCNENLNDIRDKIKHLLKEVEADEYLNAFPSVKKKIVEGGFYFHATDDPPEVRERMMRLIRSLDCSLEMVVARKIPALFAKKHHNNESEFYADLLSHLIKNKLKLGHKLVFNISARGTSTRNINLELALNRACERFEKRWKKEEICSTVVFNVQTPRTEPLLSVADYLCWSVQRVFERGEMRHYEFLKENISVVVDLYDSDHYEGGKNYYTRENLLTAKNKLGPLLP